MPFHPMSTVSLVGRTMVVEEGRAAPTWAGASSTSLRTAQPVFYLDSKGAAKTTYHGDLRDLAMLAVSNAFITRRVENLPNPFGDQCSAAPWQSLPS